MDFDLTGSPVKDFKARLQKFVEERMQTTMVLAPVALGTCGLTFV